MFFQGTCVKTDFLFGGVGIELSSQSLESVDDMIGFSFFGAFEGHMFPKVGVPLLFFGFITASGNVDKTTKDQPQAHRGEAGVPITSVGGDAQSGPRPITM